MNEQIEIRDTRNGEWLWVYNAIIADPHLTHADKVIYAALASFGGFQKISPTIQQLTQRSNTSERQTRDSLRNLEEKDYLKAEINTGRGNTNIYFLLKRPKGCRFCPFYLKGADNAVKGADNAPPTSIDNKKTISDSVKKPNTDVPDSSFTDISYELEDKPIATGKAKEAKELVDWYGKVSRETFGGDPRLSFVEKGYFIVIKLLKKYTHKELKDILTWYLETDKFNKFPQISAALSADTLRLYSKDNDKSDLIYDKPKR